MLAILEAEIAPTPAGDACESATQPISGNSRSAPCGRKHLKCGSHTAGAEEISEKKRHGGPRPNSGGQRQGAGRKRKAAEALRDARLEASDALRTIRPSCTARWYCVHTAYKAETMALEQLTRQKFVTFLPRTDRELADGHREVAPLFPGYLFVRFDPATDKWRCITNTFGVRRLLSVDAETPIPVPFGIVEEMIALAVVDGVIAHESVLPLLRNGQEVRVLTGIYQGWRGEVQSVSDRIELLLSIFGHDFRANYERWELRSIEDEAWHHPV